MAKVSSKYISWEAPEFEYYKKSKLWFITAGAIACSIALWGIWTRNFLFVLLVGLGFFSFIACGLKKPRIVKFSVTPKGVRIDKTFYGFDNLRSFWIFDEPPSIRELSLRSKKMLMPYIRIPLGKQSSDKIKEILQNHLPRKKHKESIIDNLTRLIRF